MTIYGRLNLTVERQKLTGSDNNWVMQNSASRWGMKGSEDLGGGLKAGFQLESGFNPANGTAADRFFGRQSEVNLGGGFGMVRLGNFTSEAYYATSDYIGMHNHETGTSSDAFYSYIGRNTGKVAYRTPNFGGATVEVARSPRPARTRSAPTTSRPTTTPARCTSAPASRRTATPGSSPSARCMSWARSPSAPLCNATKTAGCRLRQAHQLTAWLGHVHHRQHRAAR